MMFIVTVRHIVRSGYAFRSKSPQGSPASHSHNWRDAKQI
jgi:hypothetical protein